MFGKRPKRNNYAKCRQTVCGLADALIIVVWIECWLAKDRQLFLSLALHPRDLSDCLFEFASGHLIAEAGFDNSEPSALLLRGGDLPTSRQSDHFLGSTPAFLSERSSLTADSLKVLGATSNLTSNEEQPLASAAGGVGDLSRKRVNDAPPVLLGVLAAILIIGLVVLAVYFVVVRKKENVDASAGGSGGSLTGTGTAATISHFGN
ncbi:hypothetical protein K443DRAFT_8357 [Laccaria amethystina LaAM-08-1]|uniref:Unplaced genomic scaffold K443scaffold_110, whole genome shotgun sequence n=1 Tax=Laccaria amethystina LaAM-08-1 TaxID=1095629 RepID=A0A0C9XUH0_9AGAR|nr:hypothetical protein K443DRAFT_8357 [Laccaria amethystina LaAM-08-1]